MRLGTCFRSAGCGIGATLALWIPAVLAAQDKSAAELKEGGILTQAVLPPPMMAMGEPVELAGAEKIWLDALPPAGPSGDFERLPTGYRRVSRTVREPLAARVREALERAGKLDQIDPATGERIVHTITDYLPEGWGTAVDTGVPVDSLGRPIVNAAAGLPGWAQADVDALRDALRRALAERAVAAAAGRELTEYDGIVGNLVGQAIVRGIAIDELVRLDDPAVIGATTARAILDYLHFYENLKFVHAPDYGYTYEPTVYPAEIAAFATAHGARLEDVLQIESPAEGGIANAPSGCYTRTAFVRGLSVLVGQTDIWVANGADDLAADVPTGFPVFFFYECQDFDTNDQVRVSTNGYISFFQQGGGALFGTSFGNDPIPLAEDPDGYIAPWWDDLIIATDQGNTDRVSYKTEGAVDQRVFTVEWYSVSRLGGDTEEWHFFQTKLYETTGVIELHIGIDVAYWRTDSSDNATTGMENYDGGDGDCGPNCLNTNNPPPPNNYRFEPAPRPANDECENASLVRSRQALTGVSLRNATPDGTAGCGSSNNNRDVWYTYTASCAGTLRVDTCGSRDIGGTGLGVDTVLSVHSACPGTAANQLACNDDAGQAGCSPNDSAVSVALANNQQVWIRVSHFGDLAFRVGNGLFNLNVEFTPTTPPGNDLCGNATSVANGGTYAGALRCAGADGESACGSSTGNPDIWYRFVAPAPGGRLTLDTCGSRDNGGADAGPDTVLSVYSGCPGDQGNELACNDDGFIPGCDALDSRTSVLLNAGQAVRIRVSHFGTAATRLGNGLTVLHVAFTPCLRGDANCDGRVNNFDIDAFVLAIANGQAAWEARYSCDFFCANDINRDGLVNNFDIDDFVVLLSGG